MKRRSHIVLLSLVVTLGMLGLCGWFAVFPILDEWYCFKRPDSLSSPPTLPSAERIEFGKSSFEPQEGFEGKLTQFETNDSPDSVYEFYDRSLAKDGWSEDPAQHVTPGPNRIDAKFIWYCRGNYVSILWFHSEVIASGKTVVTLNYEFNPK